MRNDIVEDDSVLKEALFNRLYAQDSKKRVQDMTKLKIAREKEKLEKDLKECTFVPQIGGNKKEKEKEKFRK